MNFKALFLGFALAVCLTAQTPSFSDYWSVRVPNNASTPPTQNKLVKLVSGLAVPAGAGDSNGVIGICITGCGATSGTSIVSFIGRVPIIVDGTTTIGHYAQISGSVAGAVHDTGAATFPTSGQVIGTFATSATVGNAALVDLVDQTTAGGAGTGYATIDIATVALTQRAIMNFVGMQWGASSDNGSTRSDLRYCDSVTTVCIKDDFMMGSRGASPLIFGELGWTNTGSGNTTTSANLVTGHPGVIKCATSNSGPGNYCNLGTSLSTNPIAFDISAVTFDSRFDAQITTTATIFTLLGFTNGPNTGTTFNNGCYFVASASNWSEVCKAAGTATTNSCVVATDSNWHSFRIWATVAGTINFSIDGVSCAAAISANVPTTGVSPFWGISNTSTVAEAGQIDEFEMVITGLNRPI